MKVRNGEIIPQIIRADKAQVSEGPFEILYVKSALSGPGYYVEVCELGHPETSFHGYVYPLHWGWEEMA